MATSHILLNLEDLPGVLDILEPGDTIELRDATMYEPVGQALRNTGLFLEYFSYLDSLRVQVNGALTIAHYREAHHQGIHLCIHVPYPKTAEEAEAAFLQAEHDADPDNWDHHPDRKPYHPKHPRSTHPHRWNGGRYLGG